MIFRVLQCLLVAISATNASAAIIYESGTLGATGVPFSDLVSGAVPGTNVNGNVFVGVRLHLSQPIVATQVGGHFVASSSGTFFGAIIELDGEKDFPDSGDLSTPDVLGVTTLTFPTFSDEVFGNLNLLLEPGWYALAFGSGLFDSFGQGAALRNNTDNDTPAYISSVSEAPWHDLPSSGSIVFVDHRLVLRGEIVPEPSAIVLALASIAFFFKCRPSLVC